MSLAQELLARSAEYKRMRGEIKDLFDTVFELILQHDLSHREDAEFELGKFKWYVSNYHRRYDSLVQCHEMREDVTQGSRPPALRYEYSEGIVTLAYKDVMAVHALLDEFLLQMFQHFPGLDKAMNPLLEASTTVEMT